MIFRLFRLAIVYHSIAGLFKRLLLNASMLIVVPLVLYSVGLQSQSKDIHSYFLTSVDRKKLDFADSLLAIDIEKAYDFCSQELGSETLFEKPDFYTEMLSKAIDASYLSGQVEISDSLYSKIINFPKENTHPIFEARILINQSIASRRHKHHIKALNYAKQSFLKFQQSQDVDGQLKAIGIILRIYTDLGNFESALNYSSDIERLLKSNGDRRYMIEILALMSKIHINLGQYHEAQLYISRASALITSEELEKYKSTINYYLALLYYVQGNYSKSLNYLERSAEQKREYGSMISLSSTITLKAAIAMRQMKYSTAEYYNREALKIREACHSRYLSASSHFNIANSLIYLYKYDSALFHISAAEKLYSVYKIKPDFKRGKELKKKIYLFQNDYQGAFQTLEKIIEIDDSVYQHRNRVKLNELESNIEISKLEQKKADLQAKTLVQQNQNETNRVIIKISLFVLLFALTFSYFFYLHIKELNRRKLLIINQQLILVQLNSHFVFNVLTAIQSLLFKNQIESAIHNLTLFSNLVKKVLLVTHKKYVGIQMEVSFILEYLQLQKLRFGDDLKFQLDISDILYEMSFKIPPLLLYPYIEYAVEECVQKAEGKSMIIIKADFDQKFLYYRVIDINLGFSSLDSCFIKRFAKDKINCLDLTNERLSIYNHFYKRKIEFYKDEFDYNGSLYPSLTFKILK
jgi:hypothetical protein